MFQVAEQGIQAILLDVRVVSFCSHVLCVYSCRSSLSTYLSTFIESLVADLRSLITLIGDLNVDLLSQSAYIVNLVQSLNALNLTEAHTLVMRPESSTCLDHIWVSNDGLCTIRDVQTLQCLDFSDDSPVSCCIELSTDSRFSLEKKKSSAI